jgi:CHAD domain-containing protein
MSPPLPIDVVNANIQELLDHLPAVRRAEPEGVHQARVATRRLREGLPLVAISHPDAATSLRRIVRRIGRELGRVRELDIMVAQLDTLEQRLPAAAEGIASARRRVRDAQARRRRKAIKALEKLQADRLRPLEPGDARLLARMRPRATTRASRRTLREQIGDRAHDTNAALQHAAGVYFPNRLHTLRVAVKKLRYSVEAAEATGLWQPPRLLRDLRRVQARLGELHDLQVLLEALDGVAAPRREKDAAMLKAVIAADLSREYDAYVARCGRLQAICTACERFASHPAPAERRIWPAAAVTIAAAHVALNLLAGYRDARRCSGLKATPVPSPAVAAARRASLASTS